MLFTINTRNTLKISPGHINHLSLSKRSTGFTRQDLGREYIASYSMLLSRLTFTKSVIVTVAVSKIGVVLIKHRSESQWSVVLGCLTISRNVRCYYREITTPDKLSQRQVEVWQCKSIAFEWKDAILSFISPGSAEALVRLGGKIKYCLIACFLSNNCVKYYQNRFMHVRVMSRQCIFGTLCILR